MIEDIVKLLAIAEAENTMTDVSVVSPSVATLSVFDWHRTFTYNRHSGEIIDTGVC